MTLYYILCWLSNSSLIIQHVVFSGPLDRQVQYIVLSEKETDEDEAVAILNRILLIVPVGLGSFHFLHGAFLHSDCKCCIGLFTNDHVRSTYLYRKDNFGKLFTKCWENIRYCLQFDHQNWPTKNMESRNAGSVNQDNLPVKRKYDMWYLPQPEQKHIKYVIVIWLCLETEYNTLRANTNQVERDSYAMIRRRRDDTRMQVQLMQLGKHFPYTELYRR